MVEFVENRLGNVGEMEYQYLKVETVKISKLWIIEDYNGSECIKYIIYNIVDMNLNYCMYE